MRDDADGDITFLESVRTEGVTIKPCCSNEGSGMGQSVSDIKRICPGAKVEAGLSVHGRSYNGCCSGLFLLLLVTIPVWAPVVMTLGAAGIIEV